MFEVGAAATREPGDRSSAQRARIVRPVVGVVNLHRVEDDPFPQRPVAGDHLVDVEHVEDGGEEGRARGQELGALVLDAGQAAPLGGGHLHDAALEGAEPLGVDAQPVGAGRHVAVFAGDRQPGEVVDGPARTDRHLRLTAADLVDDRSEVGADPPLEIGEVVLRRGIGPHQLGGEAPDAQRHARGPAQARRVADHELDAAATDVDAQRGRGLEHEARREPPRRSGVPPRGH